jgi:hypothetical protein
LFFVDVEIFDSESDVRKALNNEKINQAFIINSPTSMTTIVINRELYSNASYPLQNALTPTANPTQSDRTRTGSDQSESGL